jgi:hypothetical protein
VYAPDLGYVTRTSVVKFNEHQKGGSVNLRLRQVATGAMFNEH